MSLRLGLAVYAACVDFMLQAARALHVTYRDANALLFFVIWPAVTLGLLGIVCAQHLVLRRARTDRRIRPCGRFPPRPPSDSP